MRQSEAYLGEIPADRRKPPFAWALLLVACIGVSAVLTLGGVHWLVE